MDAVNVALVMLILIALLLFWLYLERRLHTLGDAVTLLMAEQAARYGVVQEGPGNCAKDGHLWADKPSLISDDIHVFNCLRGCGSSLRHRVQKGG